MINIPGQIEIKNIAAPQKGADRSRRESGENKDSTFSSFFTQYLEAGDASRDKLKSSEQNQERAAVKKDVKHGEKLLTAQKPPAGKKGQQARVSKNRGTKGHSAGALLAGKTLHNRKKGRFIQLMAGNRSSSSLLRKRVLLLQAKKQHSLLDLNKKSAGISSTTKRAAVLAKKYLTGKNLTDNKDILKMGESAKGGEDAKKDTAITVSGKSYRKISSVIKRTEAVSLKGRNNGSLFNGADDKNNSVLKTGESEKVLGKKTVAGELSSACFKYSQDSGKTGLSNS